MKTLADYLAARGIDATRSIVEYRGEIYPPNADLSAVEYDPAYEVSVFKVVAGG